MRTNTGSLSRRLFLSECAGAMLGSAAMAQVAGQEGLHRVQPAAEFNNAVLLAVSPTGDRICLYFTQDPLLTMAWPMRSARRNADNADELRVIETGSWKTVLSIQLRQKAYRGSFFCEGQQLYLETLAFPEGDGLVSQRSVIDLRTGKALDYLRPEHPEESSIFYSALCDGSLLGAEVDGNTRRTEALIRATLPDFQEVARAPVGIRPRDPKGNSTDLCFSSDRQTLAYAVDGSLICRRTKDLGITWTRRIEPELKAWRLAISADGARIAAAVVDTSLVEHQRDYYVGIFSGRDGTPLGRLPLNGFEGIGISPNGKLLAVSQRIMADASTRETKPTVQIYDIDSGQLLDSVIHDRVRMQRGQNSYGSFNSNGIQFTSDGKYLITSGLNTKAWVVDGRP
jgi:WD40 repeat protein